MTESYDSFATVVITTDVPDALTRTERETLNGFVTAIKCYGNPSLAEIAECAGPGYYRSTVHKYIARLAEKGYVSLPARNRSRGIRLLKTEKAE